MMIRGIAAWLLAMVLSASAAHAHGGVGMQDNRCVLRIGSDIMFFTGYQPQNSRSEFCDDIPTPGLTVVALDMQETELRDMLTEIRITSRSCQREPDIQARDSQVVQQR